MVINNITMDKVFDKRIDYIYKLYPILKSLFKNYEVENTCYFPIIKLYTSNCKDDVIRFYVQTNFIEKEIEYILVTEFNNSLFYIPLPDLKQSLLLKTNVKAYLSGLLCDLVETK